VRARDDGAPGHCVRLAHSIAEACRLGWEELVGPDDVFHTSSWLAVEQAQTNRPPRYFLGWAARHAQGPAGAAISCYPLDIDSEPWPFMRVDRLLAHRLLERCETLDAATEATLAALLPTYLCGGRRVADTRVLVAGDRSRAERLALLGSVLDVVERDARESGARSVGFLFVHEADDLLREALAGRGYLAFPSARSATLSLEPPAFDTYLAGLTGHRRREVNRERRLLARAGVRFAAEPLSPELVDDVVSLQLQHDLRYGHDLTRRSLEQNLELQMEHCASFITVLTARSEDGVLRGCVLLLRRGRRLVVRQTGFDYGWQGKLPLYFGLCYYASIEHASRSGGALLDYGIEAEGPKRSRGCRVETTHGWLKLLDPATGDEVQRVIERLRHASDTYPRSD
jgi:uncharacterized protein